MLHAKSVLIQIAQYMTTGGPSSGTFTRSRGNRTPCKMHTEPEHPNKVICLCPYASPGVTQTKKITR